MDAATALLQRRRADLDRLCTKLLERETIDRDELQTVLGPRPAGDGVPVTPPPVY